MPLDDADLKKVGEMIAGALKPEALTAALQPIVAAAVTAATKPITERLDKGDKAAQAAAEEAKKAAEAESAKKAEEEAKKGAAGGANRPAEVDPAILTQIKKLEEQVRASDQARQEAEAKVKREALDRTLRDELVKAGIPADRLPFVLPYLRERDVLTEHNGQPHWKGKVKDVDGLHALDAGIADWVKSEGKIFLPAAPVRSSGSDPGQRPNSGAAGAVTSLDDLLNRAG